MAQFLRVPYLHNSGATEAADAVDDEVATLFQWQQRALQTVEGSPAEHHAVERRDGALEQLTPAQRCHAATVARGILALLEGAP